MRAQRVPSGEGPAVPVRAALASAPVLAALLLMMAGAAAAPGEVGGARLEPVSPADLAGFPGPDAAKVLAAFRTLCTAPPPALPQAASVTGDPQDLAAACDEAARVPPEGAAAFFRERFQPFRIRRTDGRPGFLTGYFEPELAGSLEPGEGFTAAVLARPDDLVSLGPARPAPASIPPCGPPAPRLRASSPIPIGRRSRTAPSARRPSRSCGCVTGSTFWSCRSRGRAGSACRTGGWSAFSTTARTAAPTRPWRS